MLAVFLEDMRLIKGIVAKWNGRMDDILLGEGKENGRRIFQSTTSEIIDAHSQVGRPQCEAAAPQATVEASPQSVDARVLHHAVNSPATAPGNARGERSGAST